MKYDTTKKRKKVHLLNTPSICVLFVIIVGAIYFLSPTSVSLEEKIANGQSPDVSLAYLQELEKSNPNDPMIPYLKAKIYYEKGNYNEVLSLLAPQIVEDPNHRAIDTYILFIKNKIALAQSDDPEEKASKISQMKAELDAFMSQNFSNAQLQELCSICLSIGDTQRAYNYLSKIENPDESVREQLYSLAMQNSMYDVATRLKTQKFLNDETKENYEELFKLFVESSNGQLFKDFVLAYNGKFREDLDFVKAQISVANSLGLYEEKLELLEKLSNLEPSAENLENLAATAISMGQLDKATLILQRIATEYKSDSTLHKLHDVYMWQGNIEQAQAVSLMLLDFNPTLKDLTQGISESRSIADMDSMSVFYTKMYDLGLVKPDVYGDFVDTIEKTEGTQTAIKMVEDLIKKDPKDDVLKGHKLRLYSYLNDYQTVGNTYFEIAKIRPLMPHEALYAADAFVMIGQDKNALKAMTLVDDWQKQNDEYIEEVASLAWGCNDRKLSLIAQNILLDRNSVVANSYQLVNSIGPINETTVKKLIKLYSVNNDDAIIMELLAYSSEENNYELMQNLIDLIKDKPLASSASVLPYRATLLMRNKDYAGAKSIYEKMLDLSPRNLEAIDGLANIALLTDDTKAVNKIYQKYKSTFETNPNAWIIAANLADTLGYRSESKFWYEKYLSNVKQPQLTVMLAYASLLEESGYIDKAFKIRQFIIANKTNELLALDDDDITLSSIVATVLSTDKSRKVIERQLKNKTTDALSSIYIESLLAKDDVKGALYKRARTVLKNATLTDTQELVLAVRAKDKAKIAKLLETGVGISDANKYEALSRINRRLEAYRLATSTIGTHTVKNDDVILRDRAAADSINYSRYIQTLYTAVTNWGVRRYEAIYHAPYKLGQIYVNSSYQTAHAPSALNVSKISSEKRINGEVSYEKEKYSVVVGADIAKGESKTRYGLKSEVQLNLNERYTLNFTGALNQHSTLSNMMSLLGKDDYIAASFGANPWGNDSIVLTTRAHKYSTRWGENLGHGVDLEGVYTFPIFFSDPAINVYLSGNYQNNVLSNDVLSDSNAFNKTSAEDNLYLTSGSYISDKYRHVAIGTTIGHGNPQVAGPNVPSPRFLLDVSVGYNFGEKKVDSSVSMGIGTSVFNAQDELSLRSGFQTVDRQGDRAFNFTVGYYSIF